MSQANRTTTYALAFAAVLVACALTLWPTDTAYAGGRADLVGKSVLLKLAHSQNPRSTYVEDLKGKVTETDDVGVWIDCETRTLYRIFTDGTEKREEAAYAGKVFIPWDAVNYIKLK